MALRSGHGKGAGAPRIEVLPANELPDPLPVLPSPDTGADRGHLGRFTTGNAAASRGGKAKAGKLTLARSLGLTGIADSPDFEPYRRAATTFRKHHTSELARIAGGHCGAGPASMIASAALQLAASRFLFDRGAKTGDTKTLHTASTMANDSRQNLLAAYELAQKEAKARPKESGLQALYRRHQQETK